MNFEIKVIDNFFNIDDFNRINNIKLDNIESNKIKVYHNTINKKTRVGVNRSQNSLIRGRVGDCPTTKDIKKNKSASWNIAKNKSESLYCDRNRLPFNNKRCTPAA